MYFSDYCFTTSEMLLRRTWFPLLLAVLLTSLSVFAFYFSQVENSDLSSILKNLPFKQPAILSKQNGKCNSHFVIIFNGLGLSCSTVENVPWGACWMSIPQMTELSNCDNSNIQVNRWRYRSLKTIRGKVRHCSLKPCYHYYNRIMCPGESLKLPVINFE